MPAYAAPTQDMLYLLRLFGAEQDFATLPGLDAPLTLMRDVLEEAGRFASDVAQPLNRNGDEAGCTLENGVVRTPPGFKEAYVRFVDAGWGSLSHDPNHGGQGLPRVLQLLFDEMLAAANFSFGLFPGLTRGAVEMIERYAQTELRDTYLTPMVEGRWTGAMALTEAHAGTDLGLLRTRAEPIGDGLFQVTGSKIFISAGDHDLAENIIHLVLARLPGAPPGVKGISLFLVPKFLPNDDGRPGQRNDMTVGSIEHKMGLMACPTCVMHYEGATGWLLGPENGGLSAMFTMMNAERLFVGIQGLGIAEAAYQGAVAYARERIQGRAADGSPQSILAYPDVRRMLLNIRAFTEGGRALAVWTALEMEQAQRSHDPGRRQRADERVALLTPVIKASFSDLGFEAAVQGQQVLGGHGYVREWGMEQLVRDARIAQIYEGTNGIQALDLVGRKLAMDGGRVVSEFFALMRQDAEAATSTAGTKHLAALFNASLDRLERTTDSLRERARHDPVELGAAATDYLRLFAFVALGWMWLRMAHHASTSNAGSPSFLDTKRAVAEFYLGRILPQTAGLEMTILTGRGPLLAVCNAQF